MQHRLPTHAQIQPTLSIQTAEWLDALMGLVLGTDAMGRLDEAQRHHDNGMAHGVRYALRTAATAAAHIYDPANPMGTWEPPTLCWHTDDGPTTDPILVGQLCRLADSGDRGNVFVVTDVSICRLTDGSWSAGSVAARPVDCWSVGTVAARPVDPTSKAGFSGHPIDSIRRVVNHG